jgi:hypothetical protein
MVRRFDTSTNIFRTNPDNYATDGSGRFSEDRQPTETGSLFKSGTASEPTRNTSREVAKMVIVKQSQ